MTVCKTFFDRVAPKKSALSMPYHVDAKNVRARSSQKKESSWRCGTPGPINFFLCERYAYCSRCSVHPALFLWLARIPPFVNSMIVIMRIPPEWMTLNGEVGQNFAVDPDTIDLRMDLNAIEMTNGRDALMKHPSGKQSTIRRCKTV